MFKLALRLSVLLVLIAGARSGFAADWVVQPGGSIQVIIEQAQSGDRILVEPGTYSGGLNYRGKDLEIISTGGPAVTVIDGTGLPLPTISLNSGETVAATLEGFEVMPSQWTGGGCIRVASSGVTLRDCVLNGAGASNGGSIWADGSDLHIEGTTFAGGSVSAHGGGVYASMTDVTIAACSFDQCSASGLGGAVYLSDGDLEVDDSVFTNSAGSTGGAIYVINGPVEVDGSSFASCLAEGNGGAIYVESGSLEVIDTSFSSCSASSRGGALWVASSSLAASDPPGFFGHPS